jgi:hypothetical protein
MIDTKVDLFHWPFRRVMRFAEGPVYRSARDQERTLYEGNAQALLRSV